MRFALVDHACKTANTLPRDSWFLLAESGVGTWGDIAGGMNGRSKPITFLYTVFVMDMQFCAAGHMITFS